jgi:membrane protein DedA with SNARE-associated domain
VTGPLVGYEIGRRLGRRLIAARRMRAVAAGMDRAQAVLRRRGGLAVLPGRFVACCGPGTPPLNEVRVCLSAAADQVR